MARFRVLSCVRYGIEETCTRNDTSAENRGGLEALNRPLARMFSGGEDEDRTHDLRIANATLSQLSYPPTRTMSLTNSGGTAALHDPGRSDIKALLNNDMAEYPMSRLDPAWLDVQYNNRARIPEHPQIFERWA